VEGEHAREADQQGIPAADESVESFVQWHGQAVELVSGDDVALDGCSSPPEFITEPFDLLVVVPRQGSWHGETLDPVVVMREAVEHLAASFRIREAVNPPRATLWPYESFEVLGLHVHDGNAMALVSRGQDHRVPNKRRSVVGLACHDPFMRSLRLNLPQRVVVVVATGLALVAIRARVLGSGDTEGWFNYAPNSGFGVSPSVLGRTDDGVLVLTSLMVIAWLALALWLFRSGGRER
jgi:hypothetical protein